MTATPALTTDLQRQVLTLEDDLRKRVDANAQLKGAWLSEHAEAVSRDRTAASWQAWRDDRVTQAAVGWVLATVFIRFCEDNILVTPVWISGPEQRRQEALDAQLAYFRRHPEHTDREWLQQAIDHLAELRATAGLFDQHSALLSVSPSGDAVTELLDFWRRRGDDGALVHDLHDESLSTRFLGDLYQDLSQHAKETYALLQTPEFVEEFILDRTLEPALKERPLEGFRLIDPTCGSGHFLLGAFARLVDRWHREAPALELQARVQLALDAIHGVDLNPFAVAIARFRLMVAALKACGLTSLEEAPAFAMHLAVGDSLLHGSTQTLFGDADFSAFTYATEDLEAIQTILTGGRYDVVVGNPPYITVKDKTLNAAYRKLYSTCKGKYAMTVPFMERFFDLAKPATEVRVAGWVGQITSNSFMKREFGAPLIEEFLSGKDLRLVADTSGAYIPGHGTPTVIVVGRNQKPVSEKVRAVLGVRGEPGRPDDPAKGIVWRSIVEHIDTPGWDDDWVTVTDLERSRLGAHPWSLSGGGAVEVASALEATTAQRLGAVASEIGISVVIGEEEGFELRPNASDPSIAVVMGDLVRDYNLDAVVRFWPYDDKLRYLRRVEELPSRWPYRTSLRNYVWFGKTREQLGNGWLEYGTIARSKAAIPLSIAFAFVATHNHFVLDRGGKVFKQSAPVIKLPEGAREDDHLALLGVLNSSTACFWLKQNSHDKGNGGIGGGIGDEKWEPRFEFTSTTLQDYPLPLHSPLTRGRELDRLAQDSSMWTPSIACSQQSPTVGVLTEARQTSEQIRARMIGVQEELDWEVYQLYGLIDEDLTYSGDDLPGVALGERAFEIVLARAVQKGEEETAWFVRHGSTPITEIPEHWPSDYRNLVQRRLDVIGSNRDIRLLERPEYKRRWAQDSWETRQERAVRDWLLGRLEDKTFWFDSQGRALPRSVAQLADNVARDTDLVSVLALWEGRPDIPVTQSLVRLLADEAVPYLTAYRYREPGLRKREAWEQTWALQRREDAGEKLDKPISVPPKYTSVDFTKQSYWQHRGKLDVPKERFILYPSAGRETDPTPLLGWAGWDHAQQSLALSLIIGAREADGWDDDKLVPLVAGLAELQPWVEQWHAEVDPTYGVSLAAFCAEQLSSRAAQVGMTLDELGAWRPAAATRGRKPQSTR